MPPKSAGVPQRRKGTRLITLALKTSLARLLPLVGQTNFAVSSGTAELNAHVTQAGPTQVDAPVRVASDGENAASGGSTGGEQTAGDSSGTAQVGSAGVSAPIRVANASRLVRCEYS